MSQIRTNVALIAEALKRAGADSITLRYSGSGDSGSIDDTSVDWLPGQTLLETDEEEALGTVELFTVSRIYVNDTWETKTEMQEMSVSDAVSEVWEMAIEAAGLSGFGNDSGGEGWMTIDSQGHCNLSHAYFESTNTDTVTSFDDSSPLWPNFQRVATVLREIGAGEIVVDYEGSGDSGGVNLADVRGAHAPYPDVALLDDPEDANSEVTEMNLTSAAEDLAEAAISEAGHDGYVNNDGGYGTFTITADGEVTLEHTDRYTESVDGSVHNFDAENVQDDDNQ